MNSDDPGDGLAVCNAAIVVMNSDDPGDGLAVCNAAIVVMNSNDPGTFVRFLVSCLFL